MIGQSQNIVYNLNVIINGVTQKEGEKMGKASTRAHNKYNDKAYDRINLTVPKGKKDKIKEHAELRGESVNGFINRAIDETMNHEKN